MYITLVDDASRIKNAFCNINQEQGINDLIDTMLSSTEQGKWPAFLEAIRKAGLLTFGALASFQIFGSSTYRI